MPTTVPLQRIVFFGFIHEQSQVDEYIYIWALFKSNIPVPLKFMQIILWYSNLG